VSIIATTVAKAVRDSIDLCEQARWEEASALLQRRLREESEENAKAALNIALARVYNDMDWALGLGHVKEKHAALDRAENAAAGTAAAHLLLQRGIALHLEFIMAEGDPERELDCFRRAADLYQCNGEQEDAALATAYIGIFYHVVRLDRDAAEPILHQAYEMAPPVGSTARAEAARHLGQIRQERGDPVGALPLLEESLRQRAEAGHSRHLASALHALGFACLEAGDLKGAEDYLRRARENGERYSNRFFLAMVARTEADLTFTRYLGHATRGRSHP
jgi:tetratricopeptide (TPR) repeat protein